MRELDSGITTARPETFRWHAYPDALSAAIHLRISYKKNIANDMILLYSKLAA
jgi:hypothetical protein